MFANDTNIFLNSKKIEDIITTINVEFKKIYVWLCENKLSLMLKTHLILFLNLVKKNPKCGTASKIQKEIIFCVYQTKVLRNYVR